MFSRNPDSRLLLTAVDGFKGSVHAHYNPKEIQVDQAVPWSVAPGQLTYGKAEGRSFGFELLFDCFEVRGASLEAELDTLRQMAVPKSETGKTDEDRRPPVIGISQTGVAPVFGVLESLSVKVLMFSPTGKPVRAMVTVKFKEVTRSQKGDLMGGRAGATPKAWIKATVNDRR